ncbi:hypothetical protein AXX17_AT2G13650 [Arabidopsis thaliana]|uniref:F-box associated beta-propeller type 1 domain-containing protein n=2 Tax=Arabidopsis TaxID=3701 RepID=A0A178W0V6_ARATH|nr:hypothetical protein AXX17_AT2G13650 [Arabidopsis thaliana]
MNSSAIEIWITTKIELNVVLWMPFLKVYIEPLTGLDFQFYEEPCGFFIDEEKKVFVVFELDESQAYKNAYIIGENICLKKLDLGEVRTFSSPIVCSSCYVSSLVKIKEEEEQKEREEVKANQVNNKV